MRDFIKWLGVNEKVAKVMVWMFIIMSSLIMTNALLESIGLPYYKITVDNLLKIDTHRIFILICSWLMVLGSFYSVVFLVFDLKNFKEVFKYSLGYLVLNIIITGFQNYIVAELFVVLYTIGFCYFYSKKNAKYLLHGVSALIFNFAIQYVCYLYKVQYIDYSKLNSVIKSILSVDYFIIMLAIILVKEIYLKNRRKKICGEKELVCSGLDNLTKKTNLPKN